MNAWWTLEETLQKPCERKILLLFFFLPFNYRVPPLLAMHCSYGTKNNSFDSTIVGFILIFSGAKNSALKSM